MPPRPVRQLQVLDALRAAYERTGSTPELTALSRTLGISYSTLRDHLRALEAKGELLLKSRGPGRSPHLTLLGGGFGVPLYGDIAAGLPVGAYPTPEGHLSLRGRPDQFALRVRGDSMADRIEDGDVVLLHHAEPQRPGEICAVRVGEDETTLKYLDWSADEQRPRTYRLRPHNPAFSVVTVAAQDLHVDGVFRGLLRGDIVQDLIVEGSE
ncbi:MAG TPA: S24 family peptidase [Trueperaceae bacterium]|nr:S24 family peptidase [Trueperaceae bacterium]HRP47016.1 S24 family peptidase [Trueperaceae bacterium]